MVRNGYSFFIPLGVKEEFKIRQNKTLLEGKRYKNTILFYNEKIGGILQLLWGNSEYLPYSETSIGKTSSKKTSKNLKNGDSFVIFSM